MGYEPKEWAGKDCFLMHATTGGGFGLDAAKTAQMIYESKNFNGLKLHLLGSIWGNGKMPWFKNPNKPRFNMAKDDEEYYEAFDDLCGQLGRRHLKLDICFGDQYFTDKDAQHQKHPHPFRLNNAGFDWGASVQMFYNAYDYAKDEQTWLSTSPVNKKVTIDGKEYDLSKVEEDDPSTYVVLIEPVARYFDRIVSILDAHNRLRGYWRSFNEQGNKIGGNTMIDMWIRRKLMLAGISKRWHWKEDYAGVGIYDPKAYKGSYNYVLNHGGYKEFHHSTEDRLKELGKIVDLRGVWASDDGNPDGDVAGQSFLRRQALNGKVAGTDLKISVKPGNVWHEDDMQKNVDENFEWMDKKL